MTSEEALAQIRQALLEDGLDDGDRLGRIEDVFREHDGLWFWGDK